MSLSKEQRAQAELEYKFRQLSADDTLHYGVAVEARNAHRRAGDAVCAVQNACAHPLIMRQHVNKGNTGNYDKTADCYWTDHFCELCHKRWTTGQQWEHVGTKRGLPDDEAARMS